MLQPNEQWIWELNEAGQLTLHLDDDMLFQTPYRKRFVSEVIQQQAMPFSLEDAGFYEQFMDALNNFSHWSLAEKVQVALNASAVIGFYKPVMPKSWFYHQNPAPTFDTLPLSSVVKLHTKTESGNCIVIDDTDDVVTTLLLDEKLVIDDHNEVKKFEVIKVMKNRIFECAEYGSINSHSMATNHQVVNY